MSSNIRPLSEEALAAIPVLRSLVISEKGTSTVRRILTDYCKEEGEPLPFQRFGFPSAVEYLKATGEFILRTHLGETSIFVKPKQDSNHIQKMVAAQKDGKQMQKRKNIYHWNNPQYKSRNPVLNGYQSKSQQPQSSYFYQRQNNSSSNPLQRFFPSNSNTYYPKIVNGNENVPPKPTEPPKVVPSYAKVVNAVKVEQPERKPLQLVKIYDNVPPLPAIIPQQAYVHPQPSNNFVAKRETAILPNLSQPLKQYQSYVQNDQQVKNQNQFSPNVPNYVHPSVQYVEPTNRFPSNPFHSNQFVPPPKNMCAVQAQTQPSTNPFTGCQRSPPGFNHPANQPNPFQQQPGTNPFKPFYHQPNSINIPNAPHRQQQPAPTAGEQIIDLLDQQVQLLHNSVRSFKNSYQTSRVLLQSTLDQEVAMMEAIVHHYQQSVSNQQQRQQAAVERLNQQLELLHECCRTGTGY